MMASTPDVTRYREVMQPLRWERRPDGLRAPALVCAFKGWNDAGESATAALSFLGSALDASRFATIDPEEFVDFQSTRPTVRLPRHPPRGSGRKS